ncbi:MAG: hypothetical protein QOJ15_2525 [Bradyrhizobium sp.]|nr:hypothetical protein [Bradyrhizobium sp.]
MEMAGARVNEITQLEPRNITFEKGIHVFRIVADATKGAEARITPSTII